MEISKNFGRANEMGQNFTISRIHCLRTFEEKETGAWAMVCFDESDSYTVGVGD
jgi:hypothetical protein